VSRSSEGWTLTKGAGRVLGTYATKELATRAARIVASANPPSQVNIQGPDGTVQVEWIDGPDRSAP
jgi:hypothetical protein